MKQYKYIIFIAVMIISVLFYWFQYRPTQIKKTCSAQVENMKKSGKDANGRFSPGMFAGDRKAIDGAYNDCTKKGGL